MIENDRNMQLVRILKIYSLDWRKKHSLTVLSKWLSVSVKTIRRDIKALRKVGIKINFKS